MKRASLENRGGEEGEPHPHQESFECVFPVVRRSAHHRLLSPSNSLLLRINKHAPPCSHRQRANTYLAAANLDPVSASGNAHPESVSLSLSLSVSVHLSSSLPSPHLTPLPVCLPPAGLFPTRRLKSQYLKICCKLSNTSKTSSTGLRTWPLMWRSGAKEAKSVNKVPVVGERACLVSPVLNLLLRKGVCAK